MITNREVKMLDDAALSELFIGRQIVGWDSAREVIYLSDGVINLKIETSDPEMACVENIELCGIITSVRIIEEAKDPWDMGLNPVSIYSVYAKTSESYKESLIFWILVYQDWEADKVTLKVEDSDEMTVLPSTGTL
jgi:hypothetical protein